MENLINEESTLHLNSRNLSHLMETAKWAKVLAIIGFIGLGIMVLIGLFGGSLLTGALVKDGLTSRAQMPVFLLPAIYIGMAVLYYFPLRYLYSFATQMKSGVRLNAQMDIDSAFENLKKHYKFIGIFTIVILSIYVLVAVFGVVIALMMAR